MNTDPYRESYYAVDESYFKDDYDGINTKLSVISDSKSLSINKVETKEEKSEPPKAIQLKGNSTIKDESIGSIMNNMSSSVKSFSEDFKKSLDKVKYDYDMNNTNDYETEDIVKIHYLALIDYMNNGPSIAYIGVFIIFISFIIYIFNIIVNKNAV
jgi:hypothetical protein